MKSLAKTLILSAFVLLCGFVLEEVAIAENLAEQASRNLQLSDSEEKFLSLLKAVPPDRNDNIPFGTFRWNLGGQAFFEGEFEKTGKILGRTSIGKIPPPVASVLSSLPSKGDARTWLDSQLKAFGVAPGQKIWEGKDYRVHFADGSSLSVRFRDGRTQTIVRAGAPFASGKNGAPAKCRNETVVAANCEKAFGKGGDNDPVLRPSCKVLSSQEEKARCEANSCQLLSVYRVLCPDVPGECEQKTYVVAPSEFCD